MAKQQIPSVSKPFMKTPDYLFSRLHIKIYQHIPAQYHIHLSDKFHLERVEKVKTAEIYKPPDVIVYLIEIIFTCKIFFYIMLLSSPE